MKSSKFIFILLLFLMPVIQSCGSGGGSDTSGVLTMSSPAVSGGTKIGEITNVTFTVTYTPPTGKVPNGTIIKTSIIDGNGDVVSTYDTQLYSNTSYSSGFPVTLTASQQLYSIHLSIGTMTAGSNVIIPAGT